MAKQIKMTEEEIKQWNELYDYVRDEVLMYGKETGKKFPNDMILRLKGLADGKFMANKKTKPLGKYGYDTILITFKFCKFDILAATRNVEIKDEKHMINLIMKIIENNINTVVDRLNRKKLVDKKMDNVELQETSKLKYKKKSKEVKNDRLKDLI